MIKHSENNKWLTMCVEYVYVDNARFFVPIATTSTNHQMKLPIYPYEAPTEGFRILVFMQIFVAHRDHNSKNKLSSSSSSSFFSKFTRFTLCLWLLWRWRRSPPPQSSTSCFRGPHQPIALFQPRCTSQTRRSRLFFSDERGQVLFFSPLQTPQGSPLTDPFVPYFIHSFKESMFNSFFFHIANFLLVWFIRLVLHRYCDHLFPRKSLLNVSD